MYDQGQTNSVGVTVFSSVEKRNHSSGQLYRYNPWAPPPPKPAKRGEHGKASANPKKLDSVLETSETTRNGVEHAQPPDPILDEEIRKTIGTAVFVYDRRLDNTHTTQGYGVISPAVKMGGNDIPEMTTPTRNREYESIPYGDLVQNGDEMSVSETNRAEYAQIQKKPYHSSVDSAFEPLDKIIADEEKQYESMEELTSDEERQEIHTAREVQNGKNAVINELKQVHLSRSKSSKSSSSRSSSSSLTPTMVRKSAEPINAVHGSEVQEVFHAQTAQVVEQPATEQQCVVELFPGQKEDAFVTSVRTTLARSENRMLMEMERIYLENTPDRFVDQVPRVDEYGLPVPEFKVQSEAKKLADEYVAREERKLWEASDAQRKEIADLVSMIM